MVFAQSRGAEDEQVGDFLGQRKTHRFAQVVGVLVGIPFYIVDIRRRRFSRVRLERVAVADDIHLGVCGGVRKQGAGNQFVVGAVAAYQQWSLQQRLERLFAFGEQAVGQYDSFVDHKL